MIPALCHRNRPALVLFALCLSLALSASLPFPRHAAAAADFYIFGGSGGGAGGPGAGGGGGGAAGAGPAQIGGGAGAVPAVPAVAAVAAVAVYPALEPLLHLPQEEAGVTPMQGAAATASLAQVTLAVLELPPHRAGAAAGEILLIPQPAAMEAEEEPSRKT